MRCIARCQPDGLRVPGFCRRVERSRVLVLCGLVVTLALPCHRAWASLFADITVVVHDPQHRPLPGSKAELHARASAFTLDADADASGVVHFPTVPFGEYLLTVGHPGFGTQTEAVTVTSGSSPVLHVALRVAAAKESVEVTGDSMAAPNAATPTTAVSQHDIDATPGADRGNSLAMITDYVPGAYMTHDMLHIRGGHQVSWLLDGVQIPNTNISSNLGAQIDPRDIQYLEIDRGSYGAELGDRTYGVFDVNPKSGFERNREGELRLTAGSALTTDDQLSFGDHSQRGAYYVSLNGNRSDYGLAAPTEQAVHNAENGYGGFASLTLNRDARNQFRLLTQLRTDFFQIPYDPDPDSYENQLYPSSALRDAQHETDGVAAFTWTHSFSPKVVMALSPFYHYNSADYEPSPNDAPVATTSDRASHYGGLQASVSGDVARNHLEAGLYSWGQRDSNVFGAQFAESNVSNFSEHSDAAGGLVEAYVSDAYKPNAYLGVTAGLRQSWFSGDGLRETATYPRVGATVRLPKLNWVFRGFYGHFYQPPPLLTVAGPAVGYAESNNTGFAPLHGERDEEHQFGVAIPWKGWVLDADTFQTRASNFLDHANLGESSLYFPVTVAGALVQAWELTVRSPEMPRGGRVHLAYSNQIAKGRGALTGGLICAPVSSPQCDVAPGYEALDHDQRDTLNVGGEVVLPMGVRASTNVYYGSGFANGYPGPPSPYSGDYLPSHTTFDLRFARDLGEHVNAAVSGSNVANRRVLLDNSLTFGGFHQNDPRQIYVELRYRFPY